MICRVNEPLDCESHSRPNQGYCAVCCLIVIQGAQSPLIWRSVFSFLGYSLDDLVFCIRNIFFEYIVTYKCVIPMLKHLSD